MSIGLTLLYKISVAEFTFICLLARVYVHVDEHRISLVKGSITSRVSALKRKLK